MKQLNRRLAVCVAATALVAGAVGCGSSTKKPASATTEPALPIGAGGEKQADEARQQALELEILSGQLESASLSGQRPALIPIFSKLIQVLPNLAGQQPSGIFSHQLAIVKQVRDQLGNRPERLDDTALVDDGLQASYNALRDLSYAELYVDDKLSKQMEELGASVTYLRQTSGFHHSAGVQRTVALTSGVVTKMAGSYFERVKMQSADSPTTAPASEPASTPAPSEAAPAEATTKPASN